MKNSSKLIYFLFLIILTTSSIHPADRYHSYNEMSSILKRIAGSHKDIITLKSIGKTRENRDIWLVTVSNKKTGDPDKKNALFLAGGIEADHIIGSETVLGTIQYLINQYGKNDEVTDLIDSHTSYFIPRLNPDGAERFFAKVKWDCKNNTNPTDEDHDGLVDEDPPEDLNGDGFITMMRVKDVEGTMVTDSSDKRLMREADPLKSETGIYKIYTEGIDNDHDGLYNEDPEGGVNINRNFPHNYPYRSADSGTHMVSEPETRAICDFLFSHRNIVIVVSYTSFDNLINPPKPARSIKREQEIPRNMDRYSFRFFMSRKPEVNINKADIPYYEKAGEIYKKITLVKDSSIDSKTTKPQGSFHEWAYFQYGVLSLTTPVWHIPALKDYTKSFGNKKPEPRMRKRDEDSKEKRALTWIDKKLSGRGFVSWKPFRHPQLGDVEIGGFEPFIRTNPPPDLIPELAEKHARFFVALGKLFPRLELLSTNIEKRADGVYRIEATLQNTGYLPTSLAHGVKSRAVKPVLIKLDGDYKILGGRKRYFLKSLNGSASKKYEWIIQARPGAKVSLRVQSENAGDIVKNLKLR